ncbi:MAG: TPR end-of-group domain-containing protein [Phycisphaerae bacterium]
MIKRFAIALTLLALLTIPALTIAGAGSNGDGDRPASSELTDKQRAETIDELNEKLAEHFDEKRYRKAKATVKALIDLDGENPVHWYNLACAQSRLEEIKPAMESLKKAASLGYGDLGHMQKDPDLANVRKHENYPKVVAAVRKQLLRQRLGERGERMQKLRRLHAISEKAIGYFHEKEYDKAKQQLKRALKLDPDNAITWYNMACAESRLGNPDQAVQALETAIENGYVEFRHMEKDPDLEAIRKTGGYKMIWKRRDEILRDRARKIEATLRKQFGEDYLYEIDDERKLVFATNVDRQTLDDLKSELTMQTKSLQEQLFDHSFEHHVTVVVPKSWKMGAIGGYYRHGAKMLVSKNIGMTLRHEFTHALHFADQDGLGQQHPIWVAEGFATLFETSDFDGKGQLLPTVNRRLNILQQLVKRKKTIPFDKFMKNSHGDFMKRAAIAYPQTRYIMMYLYEKGLLKDWYDAYTAGWDEDETGIKALEKVLDKDLKAIENDWKKWVLAQEASPMRVQPNQAYIGIQVRPVNDGLAIARLIKGSGADKGGLRAGDVIVKIDGKRMVDAGDLIRLVTSHKVGDTLTIDYRRDGRYNTVEVTLGKMPDLRRQR